MKLALVGRGRAGRTLAPLLKVAGFPLEWWWSHNDSASPKTLPKVDVVVLAVPDQSIENAASVLAQRPGASDEIWLHLSGSRPGEAARVSANMPRFVGCLHPLQALPGNPISNDHLAGVVAGIDGDDEAVQAARLIAERLGMTARPLDPSQKVLYHAAAVSVAGHATALFSQALDMLETCDFTRTEARDALLPLTLGAFHNLEAALPEEAITGPITRGDVDTVAAHLATLSRNAVAPHLAATYRLLALTALDLVKSSLPEDTISAIELLLQERH